MEELNLKILEEYIEKYPWYSGGYLELYKRLSGTTISEEVLSKVSARVYSRELLYRISLENSKLSIGMEEFGTDGAESEVVSKIILIGGDYFSRKELEKLPLDRDEPIDRFIEDKPSLLKSALENEDIKSLSEETWREGSSVEDIFDDDIFYTETLASIYAEQSHYKKALDIYAKLILLYPEKSSYFAALAKDIKNKHNL